MKYLRVLVLGWLIAGFAPHALADLPDAIAKVKPALVGIGTFQVARNPQFRFLGTGFAVGDGSVIATNAHVVPVALDAARDERLVAAIPQGGRAAQIRPLSKLGVDDVHDLALLKVEGAPLQPVAMAQRVLREGEAVAFSGFPVGEVLGLYPVTHRGIVSAISPNGIPVPRANDLTSTAIRRIGGSTFDIYQLDATAYPGGSGSPVFDPDSGEVIAIINMVLVRGGRESALSSPTGITYAVPARHLMDLLARPR